MTSAQPLTAFLEQPDEFRNSCATIYKPLDAEKSQVRLVHIHSAAAEDDDIHLTLEIVSLDDYPIFQAISYTWGSLSPVSQVYLHDHVYNVTQNQHEALRRFRQTDTVRTMWMDVLCINEDDVAERSSQVAMMSRIYATSQQTQIWLGEVDAECTKGLTETQWSTKQAEFWENRDRRRMAESIVFSDRDELMPGFKQSVDQEQGIIHGALHILQLLGAGHHYWSLPSCFVDSDGVAQLYRPWFDSMQAIKAILRKPYWSRVWTIQEAVLSPIDANVHFGRYEIPFSTFLKLGDETMKHGATSVACCESLDDMFVYSDEAVESDSLLEFTDRFTSLSVFVREIKSGSTDLCSALMLSNRMKAFDARDYVYGILGFVAEDDQVTVDYTCSTSEVFQTATVSSWASRGNLGFLKKSTLDCEGRMPGLPSWCIDFTSSEKVSFKFYESFYDQEAPDLEGFAVDSDKGRVSLQAFHIAAVKLRFERVEGPTPGIGDENLKILSHWTQQIQENKLESNVELNPQTNGEFFRRFFKTVFRDTILEANEEFFEVGRLTETAWENIEFWWEVASYGEAVNDPNIWPQERTNNARPRIRKHSLAFFLGLCDSTMGVTSDDQLCLLPQTAKPGDLLYHISSCCAPLVLREVKEPTQSQKEDRKEDQVEAKFAAISLETEDAADTDAKTEPSTRTFQVVGPCYIDGLMGSAWIKDLKSQLIDLV